MVRVLERLGVEVEYLDSQTCCGQPAFNTGYHDEARVLAEKYIRLFDSSDADYIVAPSGSCTTMVNIAYGKLLSIPEDLQPALEALQRKTFEFSAFIVDVLKQNDVGAEFAGKVTIHDSCHALRELHIKQQPRELLRHVKGIELIEMQHAETCCGFGGTFAVKHADISTEMVDRKIAEIHSAGVEYVTGVDSSCLMQIEGRLRRLNSTVKTLHIADILAGDA